MLVGRSLELVDFEQHVRWRNEKDEAHEEGDLAPADQLSLYKDQRDH